MPPADQEKTCENKSKARIVVMGCCPSGAGEVKLPGSAVYCGHPQAGAKFWNCWNRGNPKSWFLPLEDGLL